MEDVDDQLIIVNIEFPLEYKSKHIKKFLNYLRYNEPNNFKIQSDKVTSKEEEFYDKQVELLENCILLNEERKEESQNLVKFLNELEKFLTKTQLEKSKLNYQTLEYKKLSNRKDEYEKERKSLKRRESERREVLDRKTKNIDKERKKIKREIFENFKNRKKKEFYCLKKKLWNMWDQIELHLLKRRKRIQFNIYILKQQPSLNKLKISVLTEKKDEIKVNIENLEILRENYKDSKYFFELVQNKELIISIINTYEEDVKKELQNKINVKKIKKILEKLKPKKEEKPKPLTRNNSISRFLFSKTLQSSKIIKANEDNQEKRILQLILNKSKIYELFCSYLAKISNNEITIKKQFGFKDSYLITHYPKEKLQPFLERNRLLQRNIVRTRSFIQILGIKLDFIEITETLFRNFSKEQPRSKPKKRFTPFQKPYFHTKIKTKSAISVITIIILILALVLPYLFSSHPIVVQKYNLVKIDYQIWESDASKSYNVLNPSFDDILLITMIPITEDSTSGLILGLYNNLLGKQEYFESDLIWLNKNIDQDRNGIDDISGLPALTYGNSTDLYFNTCLMIKFEVLDIQKN